MIQHIVCQTSALNVTSYKSPWATGCPYKFMEKWPFRNEGKLLFHSPNAIEKKDEELTTQGQQYH